MLLLSYGFTEAQDLDAFKLEVFVVFVCVCVHVRVMSRHVPARPSH